MIRGILSCLVRLYTSWILAICVGAVLFELGEEVLIAWPALIALLGEEPAQWLCYGPAWVYIGAAGLRMGERCWTLREEMALPAPSLRVAIREGVYIALWPLPTLVGRLLDRFNPDE
jgi:hypothetical protein